MKTTTPPQALALGIAGRENDEVEDPPKRAR